MSEPTWTPTWREFPPEGVPVMTIDKDGRVELMLYRGVLWYHHPGDVPTHTVPVFWKVS